MSLFSKICLILITTLVFSFAFIAPASAGFMSASSQVSVDNFRFSSSADLLWTDDWYAEVAAFSANSIGDDDDAFFDGLGNDLSLQAMALIPNGTAQASVDIVDGSNLGLSPSASVSASASASANMSLIGSGQQAIGFSIPYFDNFFTLTGGTPGDMVSVTFELDYMANMSSIGSDDSFSITEFSGLFSLEDLAGNFIADDFFIEEQSGMGVLAGVNVSDTLLITAMLIVGEEYLISLDLDGFVNIVVPEPGTLLLFPLCVLFILRKRAQ